MWRISYLVLFAVLASCGSNESVQKKEHNSSLVWEEIPVKYAQLFRLAKADGFVKLSVMRPSRPDQVLQEFILVKDSASELLQGSSIHVPLKRIGVLASPHIGMLKCLGREDVIAAVSDHQYVYSPNVQQGIEAGRIKEIGGINQLNAEQVLSSSLDLLVVSGQEEQHKTTKWLSNNGVYTLKNVGWMETTPLGRAEWIKVFGVLLDTLEQAQAEFKRVEEAYNALKEQAEQIPIRVMLGSAHSGTWYTPGGKSYVAAFVEDAGLQYTWASEQSAGSIALSFEAIFEKEETASFWLNPGGARTLQALEEADSRNAWFEAFKGGRVFNNTKKVNTFGANAYWESGVVEPHLILEDWINITRNTFDEENLHYYEKLK